MIILQIYICLEICMQYILCIGNIYIYICMNKVKKESLCLAKLKKNKNLKSNLHQIHLDSITDHTKYN